MLPSPAATIGRLMDLSLIYPYHLSWANALEVLRTADEGSARTLWLFENPGDRGAFSMLGAVLATTQRLDVGIGVITPYARAPEIAAMESAQASAVGPGRVIVGVGAGSAQAATAIGMPFASPLSAVPDLVRTLRTFRPASAAASDPDVPPRVYVAATGPKMLRLAADIADGVLLSMHAPPAFLRAAADAVSSRTSDGVTTRPAVVAYVHAVVGTTSRDARQRAKETIAPTLARIGDGVAFTTMFGAGSGGLTEPLARAVADLRDGRPPDAAIPDELMAAMCRVGTLDEVVEQLLDLQATGIDEVAIHCPGLAAASLLRLTSLFDEAQRSTARG
jgi:5,10-methylenetetrahydromethanopterin reductase